MTKKKMHSSAVAGGTEGQLNQSYMLMIHSFLNLWPGKKKKTHLTTKAF